MNDREDACFKSSEYNKAKTKKKKNYLFCYKNVINATGYLLQ